ncbi:patatin-like phospholipase family protein [Segeticoccus rhizosphaerae]|uniref:patatin-like phospholipase family protein n=2 Tax=Segeticoccus rhizosphaerae TaxID=1104777 RepID=UPI0013902842|nr:patatin-like phospholipase family protein [Ornithinicoccus soli]
MRIPVPTRPQAPAPPRTVFDALPSGARIAVCCSGGGIRSAAFNLGALQTLQEHDDVYRRVRTITAVSGGSYIAAAHALAEHALAEQVDDAVQQRADGEQSGAGQREGSRPATPKAYALGSPEESHLRDHTRYLMEDWRVALGGLGHLLRGVLVNVLLVSALLYAVAHVVGWLLRATGVLHGTGAEHPVVSLGAWVWAPVALAVATVLVSRLTRGGTAKESPGGTDAPPPRGRVAGVLALSAVLSALLVIGTPYAVQGLYGVGRQDTAVGTVARTLGFSSGAGCRAIVTGQNGAAPEPACGAGAGDAAMASANGASGRGNGQRFGGLAAFVSALALMARTVFGRVQVVERDLRRSSLIGATVGRAADWLRHQLLPWVGAALVVTVFGLLFLRWVGAANAAPLLSDPLWSSPPALTGYALLLLLAIKLFVDVNETSLHGFYRDRLAAAYAVVRGGPAGVRAAAATPLSSLKDTGPELVVCAAANCTETGSLPPGRRAVSFTFTPADVGLSTAASCASDAVSRHRIDTRTFERREHHGSVRDRDLFTLFDAVAVSGAAVSPVMGKMTRLSHRLLFTLANVRLGLWVRPPWWLHAHAGDAADDRASDSLPGRLRDEAVRRLRQPDLTRLFAEAFGRMHLNGRWLYVTDGGHYENLGLVEALRRRPDLVIVLDASADGAGRYDTLGQAVALARTDCGVQVDIDPRAISPSPDGLSQTATVLGTFCYPDDPGNPHHLVYGKLAVPDDAPWDVQAYRQAHPTFPIDSTVQQLYDADEFEAYRALGSHVTTALLRSAVPATSTSGGAR